MKSAQWPSVFVVVFLALASEACRLPADESTGISASRDRPSVVLVTYCTMRADRLGIYGGGDLTPNIDALAREGVVFRNHYTQASYSGGSFASIITGKYVFHHGVYDHPRRLGDEHVTLAELFKEAGYATGAFLTHGYISPRWNYPQGIDRFNSYDLEEIQDSRIPRKDRKYKRLQEAQQWLDEVGDRTFFLWFQSQLTHYFPQAAERFVSPEDFSTAQDFRERYRNVPVGRIMFGFETLAVEPEVKQSLFALYDGAVAQTDEILGFLLDSLRKNGRLDDTVIVITADHGETLGERDLMFNHDSNVLEPTSHIPFVLRIPGRPPGEVSSPSRNIDLLPTLAALAGIEAPRDVDGESLLPLLDGEELDLPVFSETRPEAPNRSRFEHYPIRVPGVSGKVRMIRRGSYKLIHTPTPEGYRRELYDLSTDPTESIDLVPEQPDIARQLGAELERWFANYAEADTSPLELEKEDVESLRALGYLD